MLIWGGGDLKEFLETYGSAVDSGGDDSMNVGLVSDRKIAETSSKGNQEKWRKDGRWYKLDQFGYEALAETFTSRLLESSNIEEETPYVVE